MNAGVGNVSQLGITLLDAGKDVLSFLKDISTLILAGFLGLLLVAMLLVAEVAWIKYNKPLVENVEKAWRCGIYPEFASLSRTWIVFFADLYDKLICWYDALSLSVRLLSNSAILKEARNCTNDADFFNVIYAAANFVEAIVVKTFEWLIPNPITRIWPVYPAIAIITEEMIEEASKTLICMCRDVGPVWDFLTRVLMDPDLPCIGHYAINGVLGAVQVSLYWIGSTILALIVDIVTIPTGGLLNLLWFFYGNVPNARPEYSSPFEKLMAGMVYTEYWIDNVIWSAICTVVAEIRAGGDFDLYPGEYASCRATMISTFGTSGIACIVLKPAEAAARFVFYTLFEAALNVFRFVNFLDDWRLTKWKTNAAWDTLRSPNPRLGETSFMVTLPLYSNGSEVNLGDVPCDEPTYTVLEGPVECNSCGFRPINTTLEGCICNLVGAIDDALEPLWGVRFFTPLFCCALNSAIRCLVAPAKFAMDLIKNLGPTFFEYLGDENKTLVALDELIGDENEIGGLLGCVMGVFMALEPRLECVYGVFVFIVKFAGEVSRWFLVLVARIFTDVNNAVTSSSNPGVTSYLCVSNATTCLRLENAFKWLRIPRNQSLQVQLDPDIYGDYQTLYVFLVSSNSSNWLDCLCQVIDLRFINDLSEGTPIPELGSICCGFKYVARGAMEIAFFAVSLFLVVVETITRGNLYGFQNAALFFSSYYACQDSGELGITCSNLVLLSSDVRDFLKCPCAMTREIMELITGNPGDAECICDLMNGIAVPFADIVGLVVHLFKMLVTFVGCISDGFSDPTCDTLAPRLGDTFEILYTGLDSLRVAVKGLGCAIGSMFTFDCVAGDFCKEFTVTSCLKDNDCNDYGIPNDYQGYYPTTAQMDACRSVCPVPTCNMCNATITSFYAANTNLPPCPNSCRALEQCTLKDRLEALLVAIFDVLALLIRIPLKIIEEVLLTIITGSPPNDSSLTTPSFSGIIRLLFDEIGEPLFGSKEKKTWGLVQAIGDFFVCLLGPSGCSTHCTSSSSCTSCLGDIFIKLGEVFRDLYSPLVGLIVGFIELIEDLVTANIAQFGVHFQNWISNLLNFIFGQLLQNVNTILNIAIAFVVALVKFIFGEGIGEVVNSLLNVLAVIIGTVLDVIGKILRFFGVIRKRGILLEEIRDEEELQKKYGLSQEEISFLKNPSLIAKEMTNDTYCKKVMSTLAQSNSFQNMSLFEEIAFKTCYTAAVVPYLYNSKNGNDTLPLGVFYDVNTFADTFYNTTSAFYAYNAWSSDSITPFFVNLYPNPIANVGGNDLGTGVSKRSFKKRWANDLWLDVGKIIDKRNTTFAEYLSSSGIRSKLGENLAANYDNVKTASADILYYKVLTMAKFVSEHMADEPQDEKRSIAENDRRYAQIDAVTSPKWWLKFITGTVPATVRETYGRIVNASKAYEAREPSRNSTMYVRYQIFKNVLWKAYDDRRVFFEKKINETAKKIWDHSFDIKNNVKNPNKETFPERMVGFYRRAKKQLTVHAVWERKRTKYREISPLPDLPKNLEAYLEDLHSHRVSLASSKRFLGLLNTSGDCRVLDNMVDDLIGLWSYCYQKQVLGEDVPPPGNYTISGGGLIEIVPVYNASAPSFFDFVSSPENGLIDGINYLVGFDLPSTVIKFVGESNVNPFQGPVGMVYFVKRLGIPFFTSACDKDQDLRCLLGIGLKSGLFYGTLATLFVGIGVWVLLPSLAGIINVILVLLFFGSVSAFWIYTVAALSWGYSIKCISTPQSSILGIILPFVPVLPALPECALRDIVNLLDEVIRECYFDVFGFLKPTDGITCPACPSKINFPDCNAMGFSNIPNVIGYNFMTSFPNVADFLNGTCLVKGSCFFLFSPDAPQMGGFLNFLVPNMPLSNYTMDEIDTCVTLTSPVFYTIIPVTVLVGIILLAFAVIFSIAAFKIILALFAVFPLNMLFLPDKEEIIYSDKGSMGSMIGDKMEDSYFKKRDDSFFKKRNSFGGLFPAKKTKKLD